MVAVLITLRGLSDGKAWAQVESERTEGEERFGIHFQATGLSQWHPAFPQLYSGLNSLSAHSEWKTSLTSTLYLGVRLWQGAAFYGGPEVSAGGGFSHTLGIAGFPNGEVYRVDNPTPKIFLARAFLRQVIGLSGSKERIDSDLDELAGEEDPERIVLTFGKFSLTDLLDDNTYSHDPRTQFLNWALMDNGAWDYAADTRGYTWGVAVEYRHRPWVMRVATAMVPLQANQMSLDPDKTRAHGDNIELEYDYVLSERPGVLRLSGYANHAHMGSYIETIENPQLGMNIALTRQYRVKYGFGLNLEQEIRSDLGTFLRIGWNDGRTETWAFTEIDRTVSLGISLKGILWRRSHDTLGVAAVVNGLSADHAKFLEQGGYGFIIGDGRLSYAPEEILETYYLWKPVTHVGITADFQFVDHPAYNRDRGPVYIAGGRLHYEF